MPIVSASVDAFVVLATAILVPAILVLRRQPQPFTLRNVLNLLVIFHTLLQLYTLILRFPPNIFQALKVPLTTPSDTIRAVLLHRAGLPPDASLPRPLETLLTRLSSFDTRTLYVRSPPSRWCVALTADPTVRTQVRAGGRPGLRTLHHVR